MRTVAKLAPMLAAAVVGCSPPPAPPQGYAAHMAVAEEHSRRAEAHREKQRAVKQEYTGIPEVDYQCGDIDLYDQLTSGGKPIVPPRRRPCWNPADEITERERVAALREEHRARQERRAAARLVEAELAACRGISPEEIEHSPFAHHSSIAEVIPHREGGRVRGVRIVFKPVPGLTAAWMQQAIACHRARFERLGEPPTYLPDDPTLVRGATVEVSVHLGQVEVLVEARSDVDASVALARAQDLVRPRTTGS
ncbi:MAG TPA: hypothetical protein VF469_37765 [Kofleriaceae bacterium]